MKIRQEYDFFHQLLEVHFFKMWWHEQFHCWQQWWWQPEFLTEIYTILNIKKIKQLKIRTLKNYSSTDLIVLKSSMLFLLLFSQSNKFFIIKHIVSWFKKWYLSRWVFPRCGIITAENIRCYWFQGFGFEFLWCT